MTLTPGVFQINKLDKAVAAAHTFFLANPDHMEMKQNLEYYKMMAGVQQEDFKDLEARTHMVRANTFSDGGQSLRCLSQMCCRNVCLWLT